MSVAEAPRVEVERAIHPAWLWGAAAMLLVALLGQQGVLVLAAALLLCAEGVSYVWGRHALSHVSYRRVLAQRRIRWGEEVTLEIVVENRKLLPLPWLRIEDEAPAALMWSTGLGATFTRERGLLRHLLSVLWYQRVRRRYTLRGTARGEHLFGPAELRSGDIFGLSIVSLAVPARDALLVYPKVVPLTALGLPAAQPFGDVATRRRLYEDPTRTVGIRDYAAGDSPRHMHWKATARAGAPQVRVFEPVRTLRAALFLDVATGAPTDKGIWRGYDEDLLELAIVTAASTAVHLLAEGCAVGLYTNGRALAREGLIEVPPGATPATELAILEGLARIHAMPAAPLDRVIRYEESRLPATACAIVVSAAVTPALLDAAARLRAAGRAVALVCIGDGNNPSVPAGIVVRQVGGEKGWRALPALRLV